MKHEYRHLLIWKEARELNKRIYTISEAFPKEEKFGLKSQIRRASISIASNISEGSSYESNSMFSKYLNIALASLCEVETQLYLAFDIKYVVQEHLHMELEQTDKLKRMIISFMKRLKEKN